MTRTLGIGTGLGRIAAGFPPFICWKFFLLFYDGFPVGKSA